MSYCIVIRMPSGALLPVVADEDVIMEFETEGLANDTAKDMPVCRAYNFQVLEVEI